MRIFQRSCLLSIGLFFPLSAHASLLAKLLFKWRSTTVTAPAPKPKLPGQETHAYKLTKAHAEDVLLPLQNYLDGISKVGGSIQIRATDNALVATDYPENLDRLRALIPEIDRVYANPDAQARQIVVTQQLLKAIRNHAEATVVTPRANDALVKKPFILDSTVVPLIDAQSLRVPRLHDSDEMSPLPKRRSINNPTLAQFEVVGWMQDDQGYTVILMNQGRRFLYRQGKVRNGYSLKAQPLEGIAGAVQGHQLDLNDGQNHVSLKMLKWRTL